MLMRNIVNEYKRVVTEVSILRDMLIQYDEEWNESYDAVEESEMNDIASSIGFIQENLELLSMCFHNIMDR